MKITTLHNVAGNDTSLPHYVPEHFYRAPTRQEVEQAIADERAHGLYYVAQVSRVYTHSTGYGVIGKVGVVLFNTKRAAERYAREMNKSRHARLERLCDTLAAL